MVTFSVCDEITEIINKLFIYTDQQDWERLQHEVFSEDVMFDMSSMGGPKAETAAKDICSLWKKGFEGLDAINHLAGNYLVQINDHLATVFAYATATHYKASATKGTTREFVGTYNIRLLKHSYGWRIYEFKYDLKFQSGNLNLV